MRIYLRLSTSALIPFNYQKYLTGAIHKWIGPDNPVHGAPALFSFSWLQQVDSFKEGLKTNSESWFFISAHDERLIKSLIRGIQVDNGLCYGAAVRDIRIVETPHFEGEAAFFHASPILIKRKLGDRVHHYEHGDPKAGELLTETLKLKLEKAGLDADGVSVRFDEGFRNPRTKIVSYGDVRNRVNLCPVIVKGTPEQIGFAWNAGVGNSTGIGFGALK